MRRLFFYLCTSGILLVLLGLSSCSEVGYYAQCVKGEVSLLAKRRPIKTILSDPKTAPALKAKLATVLKIRRFASRQLDLPRNGSYRSYADLGRPFAVWNVVAAPRFSLTPRRWCFPVAGCVSYRGYFSKASAEDFAAGLRLQGDDVYLYGVTAFSTLTWFDDPVLNTFVDLPTPELASLIFHELAHQKLYVRGDSSFDEAFAQTVEIEGGLRWIRDHGDQRQKEAFLLRYHRQEQFVDLLLATRNKLARFYASSKPAAVMAAGKRRIFARLRAAYQRQKAAWGGYSGYDRWMASDLNNAKLASISTYRTLVPAFQELLAQKEGKLPAFYRAAAHIGHLSPVARQAAMNRLLAQSRQRNRPVLQAAVQGGAQAEGKK